VADRAGERQFMTLWLAGSLSADEQIVADFRGFAGPSRWLDLGPTLLLSMLSGVGTWNAWHDFYGSATGRPNLAAAVLVPAAAFGLSLGSIALRKIIYVAVTERQIIVVRMRARSRPARVLLAAPIGALRLTTTNRLGDRTVTCAEANGGALMIDGKQRARLRLRAVGRRSRFDGVLSAIRAQGGSVDLPPLPSVPALLAGGRPSPRAKAVRLGEFDPWRGRARREASR
jgi:hypothetical protein